MAIRSLSSMAGHLAGRFLASDKGARVLQLAGIVRFALIFVQGVVLVKAGVPVSLVGQVEFVFFVANFLMFAWQSGGQNALLTWVPGAGGEEVSLRRLGTTFVAMHLFAAVTAAFLAAVAAFRGVGGYADGYSTTMILLLAVYVLFTLPTAPIIYNYLLRKRYKRIILYILINYSLQVGVVLATILVDGSLLTMIGSLAVYAALRWAFTVIDGRWFSDGIPGRHAVGAFSAFAIPLILHAFNSGLMDYVDGWIVSGFFGDAQFAIYRYGAKELPLNTLLIGGLMTGLIPRFSAQGRVDHAAVKSEIDRLLRTLFPLNCALILLSPLLYELVYSREFIVSARIFNIYALTLLSRVIVNQIFLYVTKKTWLLAASTIGEVAINIGLSIVLLRSMGLIGIPLATVIAYVLHKVFVLVYVRHGLGVPASEYFPVRKYLLALFAMLCAFAAAELIYFT